MCWSYEVNMYIYIGDFKTGAFRGMARPGQYGTKKLDNPDNPDNPLLSIQCPKVTTGFSPLPHRAARASKCLSGRKRG